MKIFIDSDVAISSLMSISGAAFYILHESQEVELFISNYSLEEIFKGIEKWHLGSEGLIQMLDSRISVIEISNTKDEVKEKFREYTLDNNDCHIVAGAIEADAHYLLTYNLKHYKSELLKRDFNILTMPPAQFAQYLRSLKQYIGYSNR